MMFTLFSQTIIDFTHHDVFVERLLQRFKFFLLLLLKVAFIVIVYNHLPNLQPSCAIIYNHTYLMIAKSSNWKVVCGVA